MERKLFSFSGPAEERYCINEPEDFDKIGLMDEEGLITTERLKGMEIDQRGSILAALSRVVGVNYRKYFLEEVFLDLSTEGQ